MIIGTAYFPTIGQAVRYFREQYDKEEVLRKIKDGEIIIGKPKLKDEEKLILLDDRTRYGIMTELSKKDNG